MSIEGELSRAVERFGEVETRQDVYEAVTLLVCQQAEGWVCAVPVDRANVHCIFHRNRRSSHVSSTSS